jgi:hypothetical protein
MRSGSNIAKEPLLSDDLNVSGVWGDRLVGTDFGMLVRA